MKLKALTLITSITFLTGCGGGGGVTSPVLVENTMQLISKVESIEPPSKGGCVENTYDYAYDANGNLIGEIEKTYDGSCELAKLKTYSFDISGNTIRYESESILGDTNYIYESQYNTHNHLIKKNKDNDANGTVDEVVTYVNTYDAGGNRLTESVDWTTDGTVDVITTWRYPSGSANYMSKSIDSNADGVDDDNYNYNYTYDSNNNILTKHKTDASTGSGIYTYTWTYDTNNKVATESYDSDADGDVDRVYSNYVRVKKDVKDEYELAMSKDYDGDGVIDRDLIVTTRDVNNNVTEARFEESGVLDLTLKIYWSEYTIN